MRCALECRRSEARLPALHEVDRKAGSSPNILNEDGRGRIKEHHIRCISWSMSRSELLGQGFGHVEHDDARKKQGMPDYDAVVLALI